MNAPLRFHWSMSSAGEAFRGAKSRAAQSGIPNFEAHLEFCRHAENCGIESLLTAFGFHRADPIVLAASLGMATKSISFMVAVRSGVSSPTLFAQQVNTLSALTNGRICLNVVGGHTPKEQRAYGDFLAHDERYERTDEFLTVCRAFWSGDGAVNFDGKYYQIEDATLNTPFVSPSRSAPEIFLGGGSPAALDLAVKHASCLWTLPIAPQPLRERVAPVLEQGTEVGLLVSILARDTHAEAVEAAEAMLARIGSRPRKVHQEFSKRSDSTVFTSTLQLAEQTESSWVTPYLWTGAVPYLGAPAIALVGSYDEVAAAILEYQQVGISQFLFMGWPDLEEMTRFSGEILPLISKRESQTNA